VGRLAIPILVIAALSAACDRGRTPSPSAAPPSPTSQPAAGAADGAPAVSVTVVRGGAGVLVVLDVAALDARNRRVDAASVRITDLPPSATAPAAELTGDRTTLSFRAPAPANAVTVTGTSEGGATWSTRVDVRLDG
jgi:hypothetical protein